VPSNKITEFGAGKILSVMMNDTSWVKNRERRLVMMIIYVPITILGSFIIMWTLSPIYFLITLCAVPLVGLAFYLNTRILMKAVPSSSSAYDTFFETTRESIAGARDIRILGKADERSNESMKYSKMYRKQSRMIDKSINFSAAFNSIIFSVITAVIIWYGAKYDVDSAVRLVILSTAIQYINNIWTASNNMYKYFIDNETRGKYALTRIYSVMDLPEEDKESGVKDINMLTNSAINFDGISYRYNNGRIGLEKLNLSVEGGKLVAISGVAGTGKTIVARMLLQYFVPTTGQISVNGIDIRSINKRYYRREIISHCSAHPDFIPDTVRNNIKLFNPNITDTEILDTFREIGANKLADTKGFLNMKISNRSAQGLDTKNVVNIVRCIVKPASFYIFNRCFSHMNADIIQKTVRKMRKDGKTCIFLTFNSTVCKTVDEVCFIDRAHPTVVAPHKQLLEMSPRYASFFSNVASQEVNNNKPDIVTGEKIEDIKKETFVSGGAVR
jgi:ATP-binding cassette subfamily B protein